MKHSIIALALASTCVTTFATEYRSEGNERNFEGHGRQDRDDRGNGRGRPEVLPRNPGVVVAPPITVTTPVPSVSTTVRSDLNVNNVLSNTNNVAGGNATAIVKVATGDNVNNNTNNNRNVARGGAGGAGGNASVTTGNVTNENNSGGGNANVNINSQRAAASAYAPTIIHSGGADSCMGSSSGGVQGLSVGVSVGSTWKDEHCEMLRDVVRLNEIGAKETAYARMCADAKLRQAFELSGEFDCVTGKFRKVVAPVVIEKEVVKTVEVIKEVPVEVVREINVSSTCQAVKKQIRKSTQQKVCKG